VKGFTASARPGRGRLWASLLFCLAFLGCGGGGGVSTRPPSGGGGGGGGNTGGTPEVITITTPANINCVQNMPFSLTLQATGNLTPITWTISSGQLPQGLSLDSATGIISGTPTASFNSVTIVATDAKTSAARTFFFSLFAQLVIDPVTPPPAHVNAPYSVSVTAHGSSAVATWSVSAGQLPPGLTFGMNQNNANAHIGGTPTQAGTYAFTIQATDYTLPQTATLDLSIQVDTHLTITKSTLKDGEKGVAYSDSFTAVNGKGPLHWSLSGPLPAGLGLNASTGLVSGTPTDFGGTTYTVTVTDSSTPAQTDSAQLTLSIVQALQILGSLPTAYIGQFYSNSLVAVGGFYPYTWSVVSGTLPPGLSFAGGYLSGTATQLGSFTFVVQATDAGNPPAVAKQSVTLNVTPTPLNIFGPPLSPAPVNVPYHSQIPISGGTPPYSFALTSGQLPPGIALDPATGHLDGTPSQAGTFNFLVKGSDSSSPVQTATANDFIVIQKGLGRNDSIATATPIGNSANVNILVPYSISPYIDPTDGTAANPDTDYFKLVASVGSVVHVETFAQRSWSAVTLDSVVELLDESGNRLQSCRAPTYSSICLNDDIDSSTLDSALDLKVSGSANAQRTIYAHVFDWRGDARPDMQYYLNVSGVVEPLKISPSNLGLGATRGVSYQQQFTAQGGTGNVSWTLDGGTLPSGWNLSSAGLLSGTATTNGFYTFAVKATDSGSPAQTARVQFTIQIAEPLTITSPAVFPQACVNRPYSFAVTTAGGIPPISFGFDSSSWVAINIDASTGVFSGTADGTGTFTGTLGASDSAQPRSGQSQQITLTVANCP
jgi:Putative Ig domain